LLAGCQEEGGNIYLHLLKCAAGRAMAGTTAVSAPKPRQVKQAGHRQKEQCPCSSQHSGLSSSRRVPSSHSFNMDDAIKKN